MKLENASNIPLPIIIGGMGFLMFMGIAVDAVSAILSRVIDFTFMAGAAYLGWLALKRYRQKINDLIGTNSILRLENDRLKREVSERDQLEQLSDFRRKRNAKTGSV